jgi:YidC/Oxa1 family membrane protein insertase
MNENKSNFLDRGTIIAFITIMVFWVLWANFMEKKNQVPGEGTSTVQQTAPATGTTPTAPVAQTGGAAEMTAPSKSALGTPTAPTQENFTQFADDNWSFSISSKGMGLKDIDVRKYTTREHKPIVLSEVSGNYSFGTSLIDNGMPIDFAIEKTAPDTFVGRATVDGVEVVKTMKVNSATYSIQTEIVAKGAPGAFKGFATTISDVLLESQKGGFMSPSYDHQSWYVQHEDKKTRDVIAKEKGYSTEAANATVAALSSHYFTLAIADRSDLMPKFESKITPQAPVATGRLIYQPLSPVDQFVVKYTAYAGPKSFDVLAKVDENLTHVIDYGMFAVIAKPILWLLKYLYAAFGNWGWSIIVLTILVRMLVLPFNVYSFKSMKVMQKVQPEMTRIRERYKDATSPEQKMQMNQEIMLLMKAHKANPLGGCLPMLLQLPVFFALFQVLAQSIELYKSPFMLWITDLSVKDPFYVLPVLMGITMFVQQRITPSTMDPQQAKIMMWMPVIFSFFMISLPSGLTLYIFVSTLFGIIQQFVFMKDRTPATSVKPAKA